MVRCWGKLRPGSSSSGELYGNERKGGGTTDEITVCAARHSVRGKRTVADANYTRLALLSTRDFVVAIVDVVHVAICEGLDATLDARGVTGSCSQMFY